MDITLDFPNTAPGEYKALKSEPEFSAEKHLELGQPESVTSLASLGYSATQVEACPSTLGVTSAFKILSDEGLSVMHDLCLQMYSNRNSSMGTGANRLGSYLRGAGYRSRFIKDFCDSPELATHLSQLAEVSLARHSVPAVACGVNYAPEDLDRAVDSWHVDSVSFDIVMMLSDPEQIKGGEFQYFHGTKQEGQELLGITGEEGADKALPTERIHSIEFPAAGYGFLQQGNMIFHRACKLKQRAERMTMVPSFVVTPATSKDATNSINMLNWEDPGMAPELTRHEAWRAAARLNQLTQDISLTDDNQSLQKGIDQAISALLDYRNKLGEQ